MQGPDSVGLAISFSAGVLSFLSPCVLPLIPSYVTFITGLGLEDVKRSRRIALAHSLLFVSGFTLVFLAPFLATVWVSRRTDYATRALLALALDDGGPLTLEELAGRTGSPQSVTRPSLLPLAPSQPPSGSVACAA